MSQNPTLSHEDLKKLETLNGINLERWEFTVRYFEAEAAELTEELKDEQTTPMRTQYIRGALAILDGLKNFPAIVKTERESLMNPE